MSSKNDIKDEIVEEVKDAVAEETVETEDSSEKKKFKLDIKNILVLVLDYLIITGSYVLSLIFLAEIDSTYGAIPFLAPIITFTPFYALGTIVLYYIVGLYPADYDEVGIKESRRLIFVTAISVAGYAILMNNVSPEKFPHLFYIIGGTIQVISILLVVRIMQV